MGLSRMSRAQGLIESREHQDPPSDGTHMWSNGGTDLEGIDGGLESLEDFGRLKDSLGLISNLGSPCK